LNEASFRGIPFMYDAVASTVGRRTVLHEYAGRDDAEIEDLGRMAPKFTVEAIVLGEGYMTWRDWLIDVLEMPGPGALVHPYWGNRRVAVTGEVRISESTSEGGMARFTIPFTEVGVRVDSGRREVDTSAAIDAAADDAIDNLLLAAIPGYHVLDVIEAAIDNAEEAVGAGFRALNAVKGDINAALNLVDDGLAAIQKVADAIGDIIRLPETLFEAISSRIEQVFGSIATIGEAGEDLLGVGEDLALPYSAAAADLAFRSSVLMAALRAMLEFNAEGAAVIGEGAQAELEAENLAVIVKVFRTASTIEAARVLATTSFDSSDRALAVLEEIAGDIDDLAAATEDDDEYRTLVDLRAAAAAHIQSTAADLPQIVGFLVTETVPALVLAQRLYGDPSMAEDLIKRNGLRNPAAIAGGQTLEVLSSD